MGNDAHVPDVVLVFHQFIDLVCCDSSASWTGAAKAGGFRTNSEVSGNRACGEQIESKDRRHGTSTYTMTANLEDNDDQGALGDEGYRVERHRRRLCALHGLEIHFVVGSEGHHRPEEHNIYSI
jgi:hypothetical protein